MRVWTIEVVELREAGAVSVDFEDDARAVGAAVAGCSIEGAVGGLDEASSGVLIVGPLKTWSKSNGCAAIPDGPRPNRTFRRARVPKGTRVLPCRRVDLVQELIEVTVRDLPVRRPGGLCHDEGDGHGGQWSVFRD